MKTTTRTRRMKTRTRIRVRTRTRKTPENKERGRDLQTIQKAKYQNLSDATGIQILSLDIGPGIEYEPINRLFRLAPMQYTCAKCPSQIKIFKR